MASAQPGTPGRHGEIALIPAVDSIRLYSCCGKSDCILLRHDARCGDLRYAYPSALSARVLGVGCWGFGTTKPITRYPSPNTLLGIALGFGGPMIASLKLFALGQPRLERD